MKRKEKPFSYIDTHSGAGIYDLDAEWALKTGEAQEGILSILDVTDAPDFFSPYIKLCNSYFRNGHRYPGSPEIVRFLTRPDDRLYLMELHPAEIENLKDRISADPRVHIFHRDGYTGLTALCPPEPRRGIALMDPSYETADDYAKSVESLIALHRRWPVGILALWYPILPRKRDELNRLKDAFMASGIPGILTAELFIRQDDAESDDWGLTGSGMLIVQPPWKLADELDAALPWLAEKLAPGIGSAKIQWLVDDL